jgi:transcriptional regulator with XRE-family HTH domain
MRAINLSEIHRRSGLSLAHVSKIHGGSRRPSLDAAKRIAMARSMTIDELFDDLAMRKKFASKKKK